LLYIQHRSSAVGKILKTNVPTIVQCTYFCTVVLMHANVFRHVRIHFSTRISRNTNVLRCMNLKDDHVREGRCVLWMVRVRADGQHVLARRNLVHLRALIPHKLSMLDHISAGCGYITQTGRGRLARFSRRWVRAFVVRDLSRRNVDISVQKKHSVLQ
jgi:hypothetical protein